MWLINVNGEAVVVQTDVVYSARQTPSTPHFHLGETLLAFGDVDYLFDQEPPRSMSVKGHENIVKRRLQVMPLSAELVLSALIDQNPGGALTMAERTLTRKATSELLDEYGSAAQSHSQQDRAARFLEGGLDRRPIDVASASCAYQDLRDVSATADETLARYETLAQNEPESAAVWYLFARSDRDIPGGAIVRSVRRAQAPRSGQFAWALYLRASRACSVHCGEWQTADAGLAAALAAPGNDPGWRLAKLWSLLAQQKYAAVDEECERWAAPPRVCRHGRPDQILVDAQAKPAGRHGGPDRQGDGPISARIGGVHPHEARFAF